MPSEIITWRNVKVGMLLEAISDKQIFDIVTGKPTDITIKTGDVFIVASEPYYPPAQTSRGSFLSIAVMFGGRSGTINIGNFFRVDDSDKE